MATQPGAGEHGHTAPVVIVPASYRDATTGALYVHADLSEKVKPYELEDHVGPPSAAERLGDVESWAAYVKRYSSAALVHAPLVTWSAKELRAVMDYHTSVDEGGRCRWTAVMPFVWTRQWIAWSQFCDGTGRPHDKLVEFLEDHTDDIENPKQADLMNIIRKLKITSNTSANIERREDGTRSAIIAEEQRIVHPLTNDSPLPGIIDINIPVLKGQKGDNGAPLGWTIHIRVRGTPSKDGVTFRLIMVNGDATHEEAIAECVKEARGLLGADLNLLRAAE